MPELPWRKWYPQDWLADPKLSRCSPDTRGIWMDLVCAMQLSKTGTLTDTVDGLARIGRCTPDQLIKAFDDLSRTGAAETKDEQNGSKTIANRRLCRELRISELRSKSGSLSKQTSSKSVSKAEAASASASASVSASSYPRGDKKGETAQNKPQKEFPVVDSKYAPYFKRLRDSHMNYRHLTDYQWNEALKYACGRMDIIEKVIGEWEIDAANSIAQPKNPISYFRGFIIKGLKKHLLPSELYELMQKNSTILIREMFASRDNK